MPTNPKTAPQAETEKKPYEAPKLVVMGTANEMTQLGTGPFSDVPATPSAVSCPDSFQE